MDSVTALRYTLGMKTTALKMVYVTVLPGGGSVVFSHPDPAEQLALMTGGSWHGEVES